MDAPQSRAVGANQVQHFTFSLADLADGAGLSTRVPTCGDWDFADLIWHLLEVQTFWTFIIGSRPAGPEQYQEPPRPERGDLTRELRANCSELCALLSEVDPDDPAWSWSDDHTVGFTVRRQTHEALVHYVDGMLACNRPLPLLDPTLGADGVDELVRVMLTGTPPWGMFEPGADVVELDANDTRDSWRVRLGRVTGIEPRSERPAELPAAELTTDAADTIISGPALDLDLWLWGRRSLESLELRGNPRHADQVRALVVDATQ